MKKWPSRLGIKLMVTQLQQPGNVISTESYQGQQSSVHGLIQMAQEEQFT